MFAVAASDMRVLSGTLDRLKTYLGQARLGGDREGHEVVEVDA